MKNIRIKIIFIIFLLIILCTGCFNSGDSQKNKAKLIDKISHYGSTQRSNGQIISIKRINLPQLDATLNAFKLMYWSEGSKTEAYLAVPKVESSYPLVVNLHGGWAAPVKEKHVSNVNGSVYDDQMINNASPDVVTLVPMFRGYGSSDGTVNGISGETKDTQNAIKATDNYLKTHGIVMQQNQLYMIGTSTGGGVALKTASERQDIQFVVAISPFVGWDIIGSWYKDHKSNPEYENYLRNAEKIFGRFNPQKPSYKQESINIKGINTPVLLV